MDWQIPNIWHGGTVIIIGGGSSILEQLKIKKGQPLTASPYYAELVSAHTIATNAAFLLADIWDFLFWGDIGFYNKYSKQVLALNKPVLLTCMIGDVNNTCHKAIKRIKRNKQTVGISTESNEICWNYNTGAAAIDLAIKMGATRIILLGFDMYQSADGSQHFHDLYRLQDQSRESTYNRHMRSFPQIKMAADALGVEIINANPISRIDCFPRISFEEAIKPIPQREQKKLSVIVTAYLSQATIERCLNSIKEQTTIFNSFECLVGIDGCQETLKTILKIKDNYSTNFRFFYSPSNVGTYILSNSLVKEATGDYIVRFDSDDQMFPNMLDQLAITNANTSVCLFTSINQWGETKTGTYSAGQLIIKKSLLLSVGGWAPWRCAADSDLLERLRVKGETITRIPRRLFTKYIIASSLTQAKETGFKSKYRQKYHNIIRQRSKQNETTVVNITTKLQEL